MKSGFMTVNHNDPDNLIDKPEDFRQYCSCLLSEQKGNNTQIITTQVNNEQLDGGLYYQVFTNINMITYIWPVECNVQIIRGRKDPSKGFGLVIIKTPKSKYNYITLAIIIRATKPTKQNK